MEKLVISDCRDPAWNLALEEVLLERESSLLFLWRNEPSVILGRNQTPYRECDPEKLKAEKVHLVRRKSGGGAVYHDLGNLNITLVRPLTRDAVDENFRFLQKVLASCGVSAERSGRNDLEAGGRKISGSAFYEKKGRLCHHCTMLVQVDLDRMEQLLTPPRLKLAAHGVESVRSRVANLRELVPDLTAEKLTEAFCREAGRPPIHISRAMLEQLPEAAEKAAVYGSWAWTYGECPGYNLRFSGKFSWGMAEAELQIRSGLVEHCRILTDSLVPEGFEALADSLRGLPLCGEAYCSAILHSDFPPEIRKDLQDLLTGKVPE